MSPSIRFQGVYPILATPFHEDENLDLKSLGRLVRFMADIGVDGVTVLGVLGEANRLGDGEREAVVRTAVAAAGGRIPVIVGASHAGTHACLDLCRKAESLGAAAVMVAPSQEPVPNEGRTFEFYRRVAAGTGLPLVVQDHPASTGVHMSVALLLRMIAELPNVACIKEEAPPTPVRIAALRDGMKNRPVPILTGLGALYGIFDLERGSDGFNTGFAFPEVLIAMVEAAKAGDIERARNIYARFLPLIVFEQQPGIAVRKEILRLRGLIENAKVRHPGADLDAGAAAQLRALLDKILPGIDLTKPLIV
ncbi:MAG: L-2-keto-3-deoxyarabonate dehydratase [Syntrophaceae bacterium PtaU1.Bin231]|nr:MAG: L-2-keto-3-deoxyarabonate dehydratase [Syntrophaceae bacterium PtaU1.Bin231]